MTQFVLDRVQALSSSIQSEIEAARQKFESEFLNSYSESLKSTVLLNLDELNRLVRESSNTGDLFLSSKKFQEAHQLVLDIANTYPLSSADEKLKEELKELSNDLKAGQICFEALALFILGCKTEDTIDSYVHFIKAYQLFQEVATNYWDNIPLEARKPMADMGYFLVKYLLITHAKHLEAGTSSLISVFEQDKEIQRLKKEELENFPISDGESSKLSFLNAVNPELGGVVNLAVQQTRQWMELGIDISDPCVVTPLEEVAENDPVIAEYCNSLLIELVKEQMNQIQNSLPDMDESMLDDF
ncbi:MAG: hypothetical protein ACRC62_14150 [Microcoleus sp.]